MLKSFKMFSVFLILLFIVACSGYKAPNIDNAKRIALYTKPAVVKIITYYKLKNSKEKTEWSWGSGAIISSDGYIITNAHVVEYAHDTNKLGNLAFDLLYRTYVSQYGYISKSSFKDYFESRGINFNDYYISLEVVLSNGKAYEATIKSYGSEVLEEDGKIVGKDVAVIKINAENLPTIPIDETSMIETQDKVWAAGYPSAAQIESSDNNVATYSAGTITAVKTTSSGVPIYQLDAIISAGNSGGPILNDNGSIIGIATFTNTQTEGYGSAISSKTIMEYVRQAGVRENKFDSEVNKKWKEGIEYYLGGYYSKALKNFEKVKSIFPDHPEASDMIQKASSQISCCDKIYWPTIITIILISLLVVGAGVTVLIILLKRKKTAVITQQVNNASLNNEPAAQYEQDVAHTGTANSQNSVVSESTPNVLKPKKASYGLILAFMICSTVFLFMGFFLSALSNISTDLNFLMSIGIVLNLIGIISMIVALVFQYIYLFRLWAVIQDGNARTTPGKAVGFCFIPFFNLYWIFQAFWGLAVDYNAYIKRHSINNRNLTEGVFLAYCILTICMLIPFLNLFAGIALLVMAFIVFYQICDAINGLAE